MPRNSLLTPTIKATGWTINAGGRLLKGMGETLSPSDFDAQHTPQEIVALHEAEGRFALTANFIELEMTHDQAVERSGQVAQMIASSGFLGDPARLAELRPLVSQPISGGADPELQSSIKAVNLLSQELAALPSVRAAVVPNTSPIALPLDPARSGGNPDAWRMIARETTEASYQVSEDGRYSHVATIAVGRPEHAAAFEPDAARRQRLNLGVGTLVILARVGLKPEDHTLAPAQLPSDSDRFTKSGTTPQLSHPG